MTSKLVALYFFHELATRSPVTSSSPVVINMVNPGFCKSALVRDVDDTIFFRLFKFILQRTTEVGARTLVHAAAAGKTSHGEYLADCGIHPSPVDRADLRGDRDVLQRKIWSELSMRLEKISPGIMRVVA